MPMHPDFQKIFDQFVTEYGEKEGTDRFWAWVNKNGYDETKPMPSESITALGMPCHVTIEEYMQREGVRLRPMMRALAMLRSIAPRTTTETQQKNESFQWTADAPIRTDLLPPNTRIYKCKVLKAGFTYHYDVHNKIYTRTFTKREIERSARTIIGGYVDENHWWWSAFPNVFVIDAEEEDEWMECFVYSSNAKFDQLYDERMIIGLSVEYDIRAEPKVNDSLIQKGIYMFGFAVLTLPEFPPACNAGTEITLFAVGNSNSNPSTHAESVSSRSHEEVTNEEIETMSGKQPIELDVLRQSITTIEAKVVAMQTQLGELMPKLNGLVEAHKTADPVGGLAAAVAEPNAAELKTMFASLTKEVHGIHSKVDGLIARMPVRAESAVAAVASPQVGATGVPESADDLKRKVELDAAQKAGAAGADAPIDESKVPESVRKAWKEREKQGKQLA